MSARVSRHHRSRAGRGRGALAAADSCLKPVAAGDRRTPATGRTALDSRALARASPRRVGRAVSRRALALSRRSAARATAAARQVERVPLWPACDGRHRPRQPAAHARGRRLQLLALHGLAALPVPHRRRRRLLHGASSWVGVFVANERAMRERANERRARVAFARWTRRYRATRSGVVLGGRGAWRGRSVGRRDEGSSCERRRGDRSRSRSRSHKCFDGKRGIAAKGRHANRVGPPHHSRDAAIWRPRAATLLDRCLCATAPRDRTRSSSCRSRSRATRSAARTCRTTRRRVSWRGMMAGVARSGRAAIYLAGCAQRVKVGARAAIRGVAMRRSRASCGRMVARGEARRVDAERTAPAASLVAPAPRTEGECHAFPAAISPREDSRSAGAPPKVAGNPSPAASPASLAPLLLLFLPHGQTAPLSLISGLRACRHGPPIIDFGSACSPAVRRRHTGLAYSGPGESPHLSRHPLGRR